VTRRRADWADPTPQISAHRGGSERALPGSYRAYRHSIEAGADYLEFDVRTTADGELVAYHDARLRSGRPVAATSYPELCRVAGYEVPTTGGILRLADRAGPHRVGAHIDLKDPAAWAPVITQALAVLEPARVIVTSRDPAIVQTIKSRHRDVGVGLSIGGAAAQSVRYADRWLRPARWAEAVAALGADWAAVQRRLARVGVLAECRRRGLRTMVWTVTRDAGLRSWLGSAEVDVIVTDRPGRAAALRAAR
jgi:glycerophosphoryl diester phosphodiesterase